MYAAEVSSWQAESPPRRTFLQPGFPDFGMAVGGEKDLDFLHATTKFEFQILRAHHAILLQSVPKNVG